MEHRVLSPSIAARPPRPGLLADWRLALRSIAGFWLFYLATVLLRALLGPEAASAMKYRAIFAVIGVALSAAIYLSIRLFARDRSAQRMALVATGVAIPASLLLAGISLHMIADSASPIGPQSSITTQEGVAIVQHGRNVRIVQGNGKEIEINLPPMEQVIRDKLPRLLADGMVTWFFLFAAWTAIYIAMTQQQLARRTELRLAEAEGAAHAAQVRALRYQINPHFLFNTLNSLSSLVMTGRAEQAEAMLLALSNFFRTSLSIDPSADVSLAEEIALQRQYLDIERVRFPDRLEVAIDVPDELTRARVPALLLQPLVENAIKYGVSQTRDLVKLAITARWLDGGRMQLDVTNTLAGSRRGKKPLPAHSGTGLGLRNVCQRLQAHYGQRADCRYGPIEGGYQVSLAIPVDLDD
ncbi:histidine kinase [Sphingomonas sp. ASV193]|uniref:sensor histidine kinase n=1 Tax=Sphingomonas sp. ASV193 TaxID=3144405 RepID=UPI0032E8E126